MNTETASEVPDVIGVRTKGFETAIRRWMRRNRRVPLSVLLRDALQKELAPFAGKRDVIFQDFRAKHNLSPSDEGNG